MVGRKKQHVKLRKIDREYLEALISKGELTAKAYRRALALLELDRGQTYTAVSKSLQVTLTTLSTWTEKYREIGLQVLADKPRPGRPIEIDGDQRAKVTVLACSDPPAGYAEWHLRLLADKAVELGYFEHISHTSVRQILKKRTETTSQSNPVHREVRQSFPGTHGRTLMALRFAL